MRANLFSACRLPNLVAVVKTRLGNAAVIKMKDEGGVFVMVTGRRCLE